MTNLKGDGEGVMYIEESHHESSDRWQSKTEGGQNQSTSGGEWCKDSELERN